MITHAAALTCVTAELEKPAAPGGEAWALPAKQLSCSRLCGCLAEDLIASHFLFFSHLLPYLFFFFFFPVSYRPHSPNCKSWAGLSQKVF